ARRPTEPDQNPIRDHQSARESGDELPCFNPSRATWPNTWPEKKKSHPWPARASNGFHAVLSMLACALRGRTKVRSRHSDVIGCARTLSPARIYLGPNCVLVSPGLSIVRRHFFELAPHNPSWSRPPRQDVRYSRYIASRNCPELLYDKAFHSSRTRIFPIGLLRDDGPRDGEERLDGSRRGQSER